MRVASVGVSVLGVLLFALPSYSQQAAQTAANVQGTSILQQSASALVGKTTITDVTLDGNGTRIAGSDPESGSVTLEAMSSGQSSIKFAGASGNYNEVVSTSSAGQLAGSWAGPDGVAHAISYHNLLTDSSWFFPALTVSKLLASQTATATLVGQETKDGAAVTHVAVAQQFADQPADAAVQMQHVSQMDFFLDATTLLPLALDFNTHPDNNMLLDIPVEIQFSDYRAINGVYVPFHIQKYLNNTLFLDIYLQAAAVNSGLTAGAFTIQ